MSGFRKIAFHILLVALLLRGFTPAGWMPAAQGDAPLVMCSVTQNVDGSGHDGAPGKDDPRAHENCAFAAAHVMAEPQANAFAAPLLQAAAIATVAAPAVLRVADAFTPQSPRAPPSFS